jgi:hypothetical protein
VPESSFMEGLYFFEDKKLISWYPKGVIDTDTIKSYILKLKESPWGTHANRYCDFSDVSSYSIDFSGMWNIVSFRKGELPEHINLKLAIYCTDDTGFALARMYQMLTDDYDIEVMVSRDRQELAGFLGLDVRTLTRPGN